MSWFTQLRPASWRGVPFAVLGGSLKIGRRQVVHEYPDRDTVWVEDMGRATRRISLLGFLVDGTVLKGDVIAQRARMLAACESKGDGLGRSSKGQLVHPTLGNVTVSLMDAEIVERWDAAGYFEIRFIFIEAGARVFPAVVTSTGDDVRDAADAADAGALGQFKAKVDGALAKGAAVAAAAVETAAPWINTARGLVNDASSLYRTATRLQGPFGRFAAGANLGFLSNPLPTPSDLVLDDLIALGAAQRKATDAAADALETAGTLLAPGNTDAFGEAVQALADDVKASAADPADALRVLTTLGEFEITPIEATAPVGVAVGLMQAGCADLFRRAAVVALARAAADYRPSSYEDAARVRTAVAALLEREIVAAGDQGEDDAYTSLRELLAATVRDLTTRGADLARMETFTMGTTLPSLVLAQRLYRDPTREPELP